MSVASTEVVYGAPPADDPLTEGEHALKGLLNTLRTVVAQSAHLWHTESDKLAASATIDTYEKHALGALKYAAAKTETERAAVEDVSDRIAKVVTTGADHVIDYAKLAAAILAAQSTAIEPTNVQKSTEAGGSEL